MAVTLTEIQTDIVNVKAAIDKVLTAQSYGKGDKNLQRVQLADLEKRLASLTRTEAQLTAAAAGATNPAVITASWYTV